MPTTPPAATVYQLVAEKLSATPSAQPLAEVVAEAAASDEFSLARFSESQDVLRMLHRLRVTPNSSINPRNLTRLADFVEKAAQGAGVSPDAVRVCLLLYTSRNTRLTTEPVCGPKPRCAECALTAHCAHSQRRPSLKELPITERPRERLIQGEKLTDAELLAILIRDGTPKASALELARALVHACDGRLAQLAEKSVEEICALVPKSGLGPAKAAQVKAGLELARRLQQSQFTPGTSLITSRDVFDQFKDQLRAEKKETVIALLLDNKQRLIRSTPISVGSLTASIVHPREAFLPAIRASAAAVIFVHNHPSGDETPSKDDIEITRRLKEAGEIIGIKVLDHVIIGRDSYTSFADRGLL